MCLSATGAVLSQSCVKTSTADSERLTGVGNVGILPPSIPEGSHFISTAAARSQRYDSRRSAPVRCPQRTHQVACVRLQFELHLRWIKKSKSAMTPGAVDSKLKKVCRKDLPISTRAGFSFYSVKPLGLWNVTIHKSLFNFIPVQSADD